MRIKKILAAVASCSLATASAFAAVGCGGKTEITLPSEYDIPQDYCRTYYEVFVRSFADGNGDGVGDLRGLIDNLDYLNDGDDKTDADLGINGIWMMPINRSPSYHKYDVSDYYKIDDEYGTLADFDELVEECEKRDIWLQMDLVLNHTATDHIWFKQAVHDAQLGIEPEDSEAMQRYSFVHGEQPYGKWYKVPETQDFWYLGNFSEGMPDVNLKNESVRAEIENIVDFWLNRGIRSFRLDAVPWACADSVVYNDDNGEFWSWFNKICNDKGKAVYGEKTPNLTQYCYNVGEVWASQSVISDFYGTGMSNFNYAMGGSPNGIFSTVANGTENNGASQLVTWLCDVQSDFGSKSPDYSLLSNFLSNHDNDRSAGYFGYEPAKIKTAAALYLLAPGNPYIYYGEEIGAAGSGEDPNKRLPFNWGDDRKQLEKPSGANYTGEQKLGTWKEQTVDPDSILSFYRNAIKIRNAFPEIGRGTATAYAVDKSGNIVKRENGKLPDGGKHNKEVAAFTLEWNGKKVLIVHNVGDKKVKLNVTDGGATLGGVLVAGDKGGASLSDSGKLTMSGLTSAVIKLS